GFPLRDTAQRRSQRTVRGVRFGDASGVGRGRERIQPPRLVRPRDALEADVGIRAAVICTDLRAVVFDGAIRGVEAPLERIPIDIQKPWSSALCEQRCW